MKRFDHGELSIPNRTKNIERELDAYKRQPAKDAKAKAKRDAARRRELKAEAKALFAQHGEALLGRYVGAERRLAAAILDQYVKWEPAKAIALLTRFAANRTLASQADSAMGRE